MEADAMSIPSVLRRPPAACLAAATLLWALFGTALACDDYAEEQALAAAIAAAKAARTTQVRAAAMTPAGEVAAVAGAVAQTAVREPVQTAAQVSTRR
jgi:hypothetical protein